MAGCVARLLLLLGCRSYREVLMAGCVARLLLLLGSVHFIQGGEGPLWLAV